MNIRRNFQNGATSAANHGLAAGLLLFLLATGLARADEPYARGRDYDLQHSKIALRFDLDQREVLGDVTHTLTILNDGTAKIGRAHV